MAKFFDKAHTFGGKIMGLDTVQPIGVAVFCIVLIYILAREFRRIGREAPEKPESGKNLARTAYLSAILALIVSLVVAGVLAGLTVFVLTHLTLTWR